MNNDTASEFELKIAVHWAIKWISLVGVVFFLLLAFLARLNHMGSGYLVFFIAFGFFELVGFLLSFSTIRVSQKSIIATSPFAIYKIDWDEVIGIEMQGDSIAFLGYDKCFPIQLAMAGKEKVEFRDFLEGLIQERKIEVKPLSSLWMKHKNTKVEKGDS